MSKKFNVKDIVSQRKNELDYSPLFQSQTTPPLPQQAPDIRPADKQPAQSFTSNMPENQNAGIPAIQKTSNPENQNAGIPAIQHNITATEKVTYRFHPEGKYAIEDIKTILSRKLGIKASYEAIAEEAILLTYDDLLENQHASKLAKRLSGKPENQKSS